MFMVGSKGRERGVSHNEADKEVRHWGPGFLRQTAAFVQTWAVRTPFLGPAARYGPAGSPGVLGAERIGGG